MKEDFLDRYRRAVPLREQWPEWVEAQRVKHRLGGPLAVERQTLKVIGALYERFVIGETWSEREYVLALGECYAAGVSLTRAQVEKGRAAARTKGDLS